MQPVVEVKNLEVQFKVEGQSVSAVRNVNFQIPPGKTVGLVGESGCGKSVTALAIMQLIPCPPGKIAKGQILFHGTDLLQKSEADMICIRGNQISMIFQEPMTALNPVFTIGEQVGEVFRQHQSMSKEQALEASIEILRKVGIPAPEKRVREYPHQLSGGMRQRVVIAIALACKPELLIADEPTTALDVTIQMQILTLMKELQQDLGMSILFVTHDLGVVAETCDEVVVMYAGNVVEHAPVAEIFTKPQHPYTKGLIASKIDIDQPRDQKLHSIDGIVPSLLELPKGCSFYSRCQFAQDRCREAPPVLERRQGNHHVACFYKDSL